MRIVRPAAWMVAGLLIAACAGAGVEGRMLGRWSGGGGELEFLRGGRFAVQLANGTRSTGTYELRDGGRLVVTYDDVRARHPVLAQYHVAVENGELRLCDPDRPRQPCTTYRRAGR